jgi:hypothetical protein
MEIILIERVKKIEIEAEEIERKKRALEGMLCLCFLFRMGPWRRIGF